MSKTKLGILGLFVGLAVVSGAWLVLHVKAQPAPSAAAETEALSAEDRAALKQALDALSVALSQLETSINTPQSGIVLTAERQANINSALGGLETALVGLDSALGRTPSIAAEVPVTKPEAGGEEETAVAAAEEGGDGLNLVAEDQTAQASATADGFNWNKALLAIFLIAAGGAGLAFYFRLRKKEVKAEQAAPATPTAPAAPAAQEAAQAAPTANSQQV